MKSHLLLLALAGVVGCTVETADDGEGSGTGGWTASGAATGTGGYETSTGGVLGSGGFVGTGGLVSTGGFVATGGAVGSGGLGSGGLFGTGGITADGGATATGGTVATGGSIGTGGVVSTGGSVGTGGSVATGGSVGTGGTVSTGGIEPSDLPAPPGSNVAKPSGAVGGLTILNWAGFKSAVSYTFDDALSSQIQHYSDLKATGVHMTFYVVSNNNAGNQVWKTAVQDGHEVANHTAHHCHDNGSGCAWGSYAGSLANEISQCSSYITGTLGAKGVWTMAAPYGDGGYATAAQSTMFLNRGVNGGQIGANDNTDPFKLPCQTAAQNQTAGTFNSATDSAHSAGKWQIFLIHSLGGDGGYNPLNTSEVVSSINHAKQLGDVWIDSVVNVGAYWRAQKVLAAVTPQSSGGSSTWSWTLPAHFPPGMYLRVKVTGGTLKQNGKLVSWDSHGYYEISLDEGQMTLSP